MKCKECQLATKMHAVFRKHVNRENAGEADYYICPLDEDDYFPEDFDCIDEEAYKKMLRQKEEMA